MSKDHDQFIEISIMINFNFFIEISIMIKFKKIDPYRDPIMILNNIPYSTNTIRSKDDFEPSFTQKTKKSEGNSFLEF